jgi:hypothetical protein
MLKLENGPKTYLRFGISRKKEFLRDVRKTYDGLVIPANLLLYQYKSTPSVVLMCDHSFFVDPMSYLLGQSFQDFKRQLKKGPGFKPSFNKLMEGHGLDSNKFLSSDYNALLKLLKLSDDNVTVFINNALDFQKNKIRESLKDARELLTQDEQAVFDKKSFEPDFLIPPYMLYSQGEQGMELNKTILDICWKDRDKWGDIFPMVFLRKEDLENTVFVDSIVEAVKQNPFPGYCVWVDNFDERTASKNQIKAYIRLISKLSEEKQQVVLLYGGFFSLTLYYFGASCVSHGLAYGEARSMGASAQQKSGPAPIRYYFLELHNFLPIDSALLVLRARPDLMCACPICNRVLRGNPENIPNFAKEETLAEMHFLYNRFKERQMIAGSNLEEIINHLGWLETLNDDIASITREYKVGDRFEEKAVVNPRYISEWKAALEESKDLAKKTI